MGHGASLQVDPRNQRGLLSPLNHRLGGPVTDAPHRAHGHGERSNAPGMPAAPPVGGRPGTRSPAGSRPLVVTLLVAAFATALALLVPGVASAAGESVTGTLQTSRSGPIQGV